MPHGRSTNPSTPPSTNTAWDTDGLAQVRERYGHGCRERRARTPARSFCACASLSDLAGIALASGVVGGETLPPAVGRGRALRSATFGARHARPFLRHTVRVRSHCR